MLFLLYVCSLIVVHYLLRSWSERYKSLLIVGFNFFFAVLMYFSLEAVPGMDLGEAAYALGFAISQAPEAIAFQGDATMFEGAAAFYIFFLMSLYTIRAVVALLFRQALIRIKMQWRLMSRRMVYIVIGGRKDAQTLVEEIHRAVKRPAIVYISTEEEEDETETPLQAYEAQFSFLKQLKAGKEYSIVLLPEESFRNYQLLVQLDKLSGMRKGLHVTAFLDNELLRMEDLRFEHLDLYLISREQMLVRSFVNEHLPLQFLREQEPQQEKEKQGIYVPSVPFSLCVIGFESLGQEFLLQTYENTAFASAAPGKEGLRVLVTDTDLEWKKASFLHSFPQMAAEENFAWLDTPLESEVFYAAMEERMEELHQILIATPDTARNVDLALRLLSLFRKRGMGEKHPQIVVVLFREEEGAVSFLEGDPQVLFQQVNARQFTYRDLILREADRQAEALHRRYRSEQLRISDWKNLGTFTQNSNRAVVWDIPNKLLLAGDMSGLGREEREALYWQLAQYEHRRWNAFHYSRGWTKLPVDELTEEERAACKTKHPLEKRHICLVDWEELDALPQSEPGILKYYDYKNVEELLEGQGEK